MSEVQTLLSVKWILKDLDKVFHMIVVESYLHVGFYKLQMLKYNPVAEIKLGSYGETKIANSD